MKLANELRIGSWILEQVDRSNLMERIALQNAGQREAYDSFVMKYWKEIVPTQVRSLRDEGDIIYVNSTLDADGCWDYEDIVGPIPMTPKILVDCGFKESQHDRLLSNGRFDMLKWVTPTALAWCFRNQLGQPSVIVYIHYLHQLQNLYFAMCGEELTVNLTEYQTA